MTITSRDNPQVKQLCALLSSKKARDEVGLFAVEGARLCADVAQSGAEVVTVFLTSSAMEKYPEAEIVAQTAETALELSEELSARIGDTRSPQGVFAICRKLDNTRRAVTIKRNGCYLLLDSLQDPGNLGAILRTALAMGVEGVFMESCPDLYSPKTLRASMGAALRLPIVEGESLDEAIADLQAAECHVYAAALTDAAIPLGGSSLADGGGLVIGNEGNGLTGERISQCDEAVVIPMADGAESLNAAAAAAILLWEMFGRSR